jgi:hypothetical protein
MATPSTTLTVLAHQAAAEIGFIARRWWRDANDPSVLRVEVERRMVGARPAIAELTVAIPFPRTPRPSTPAPAPTPPRTRPTTDKKRRAAVKRGTARARKA